MFTASIYNSNAGRVDLIGHEDQYQLVKIEGLNPPTAQINAIDAAGIDGTIFSSSRLMTRNIVITLRINGDVEANRLSLYRYFQPGDSVRFFYTNENRDVYIDGVVETLECGLFTMSEIMQVSIICPDPYFQAAEESSVAIASGMFTAVNNSDVELGYLLSFTCPTTILDVEWAVVGTEETLAVHGNFLSGDIVTIDTREDRREVYFNRSGLQVNALDWVESDSIFYLLPPMSTTEFRLSAFNGAAFSIREGNLTYREKYRGV